MALKVQYLGWASFLFTGSKGSTFLTDPFLAGDEVLGIPATPVDYSNLTVDLIVASHPANDHFAQAMEIMGHSETTKILGDHTTMIMAEMAGFGDLNGPRCELTTSGATYPFGEFQIKAVDARHIAFRHFEDGRFITGEPLCYIIKMEDGPTVFFGGDTSVTLDMKLWGELYKPEIAFIGIGGVDLGGRSLDEMDPEDAAVCAKMLGVKKAIPMHYRGTEYLERFKKALAEQAPGCECISMSYGEEMTF